MIRFNINGEYLELYSTNSLQFTDKNMLFAFDEIQLSRTTEFAIPATPKNNAIFRLANEVAGHGDLARQKIKAQLQFSSGAVDGYLYINRASKEKYNIIFYYGDLLGLKTIKEAGVIADFTRIGAYAILGYGALSANDANLPLMGNVSYQNGYALAPNPTDPTGYKPNYFPLPSVSLGGLIREGLDALHVSYDFGKVAEIDKIRFTIARPQVRDAEDKLQDAAVMQEVLLRDNLPELTMVELLKIAAAATNSVLYYENETVYWVKDIFDSSDIINIDSRLLKISDIERTFGDWAQNNVLTFADGDWVRKERIKVAGYTIGNENLESQKELLNIPFSRCGTIASAEDYIPDAYIPDLYYNETEHKHEFLADAGTLFYCSDTYYYGKPIDYAQIGGLLKLCQKSTQIKVQATMTLYEYNKIKPRTMFYVRGGVYVWTSKQWQDGVITLQLSGLEL